MRLFLSVFVPFTLVFFVFCLMVDWLMLNGVIYRSPSQGAAKINRLFSQQESEIPIFGTSRALGSFLPDSFSLQSYNYGVNGIGFDVIDMMLRVECEKKESALPIIICFDYEMFYRALADVNSYIPNIRYPQVRAILDNHNQDKFFYRLPGIRFFGNFDYYLKDYLNERMQLTKVTSRGASLEKNKLSPQMFAELVEKRKATPNVWNPHKELIDSLFVRIASRPDREFLIVVAPYHKSYYEVMDQRSHRYAELLLDSAQRMPNAKVIRFDGQDWADSLFLNTTHLNLEGAIVFTRKLRSIVFGEQQGDKPFPLVWPPGYVPEQAKKLLDSLQLQDSLDSMKVIPSDSEF